MNMTFLPKYHDLPDATPLAELELSIRASNAFSRAGLTTLGHIRSTPDNVLRRWKGIGAKTIKEIRLAYGYSEPVPPPPSPEMRSAVALEKIATTLGQILVALQEARS